MQSRVQFFGFSFPCHAFPPSEATFDVPIDRPRSVPSLETVFEVSIWFLAFCRPLMTVTEAYLCMRSVAIVTA